MGALEDIWTSLVRLEHQAERWFGLHSTSAPDAERDGGAPEASSGARAAVSTPGGDDPIVGPAFPWLTSWTPTDRRALLDAQRAVGLDPLNGGLLAVIDHESGGKAAALNPLPAAGLIQITKGANLPGFGTADKIREVATWTPARQLAEVVVPFYQRTFPRSAPQGEAQGGVALLRRNFLPGVAGQPEGYVLGVRDGAAGPGGETADDRIAGGLTRGAIYRSNPGFDPCGARGYFTWADVDRQSATSVARGKVRGLMTVSGAIVQAQDSRVAGAPGPWDGTSRGFHSHTCPACGCKWTHGPGACRGAGATGATCKAAHLCPRCGAEMRRVDAGDPAIGGVAEDAGTWLAEAADALVRAEHDAERWLGIHPANEAPAGDRIADRTEGHPALAALLPVSASLASPPPPAGLTPVRQADVTPAMAAFAAEVLHDKSVPMGGTSSRDFDGRTVVGRVEVHAPSAQIDHPHRGVSLYWQGGGSISPSPATPPAPSGGGSGVGPAPALLALLRQIDAAYPSRSRASDGIMADAAHIAAGKSDHITGDALDVTRDVAPGRGPDLPALADALRQDRRVSYVILDRQIANRAIQDGKWRDYAGTDPHTSHLHVSILHDRRDDASPWTIPSATGVADSRIAGAPTFDPTTLDAPTWAWVDCPGGYRVQTNAEPLSRGGVPVPMSFRQEIAACVALRAVPLTAPIEDARLAQAHVRTVVPNVPSPDGAHMVGTAKGDDEARRFAGWYGPLGTVLRAGGSKSMLAERDRRQAGVAPDLAPLGKERGMAFYGWLRPDGSMVEKGRGDRHDADWIEYGQYAYVTLRAATKDGEPVDLLAELARGCPLGGPLAPWVVAALGGVGGDPSVSGVGDVAENAGALGALLPER